MSAIPRAWVMLGGGGVPKISGGKEASARIRNLSGPEMVQGVGKALFVAGQTIEVEAAHSITAGAVSGKNHVPSKPGEPPSADTHVLDRSIETVLVEPLKVEVSANAPYAAALEYGTSKMAARPYMGPAVARKKDEVVQLVGDAVKVVVSRGR